MSIETCADCGAKEDTDYFDEMYREDFAGVPLCENCYEDRIAAEAEKGGDCE